MREVSRDDAEHQNFIKKSRLFCKNMMQLDGVGRVMPHERVVHVRGLCGATAVTGTCRDSRQIIH